MKNYIENWAKMILKESEENTTESYADIQHANKEWDEPGDDSGRRYGDIRARGFAKKAWGDRGDEGHGEDPSDGFIMDNMDKFVISGTKRDPEFHRRTYIHIETGKDGNPTGWTYTRFIEETIPFKSHAEAEKFIELFRDLPWDTLRDQTLGMLVDKHKFEIVSIKDIARKEGLAEAEAEDKTAESDQISENNDIPGKRYDWKPDFQFTNDVVDDLKNRDLLKLGQAIGVLLPVNRENGPTRFNKTVERGYDENGTWRERPATAHDNEVYDVLHIELDFRTNTKEILIDRYFGYSNDKEYWGRSAGGEERDWSETPVLTKSTVESILMAYKDHNVFYKIGTALEEYVEKQLKFKSSYSTNAQDTKKLLADRPNQSETQWVENYMRMYPKDNHAKGLKSLCDAFQDGSILDYKLKFLEPEIPTEEYDRQKFEEHTKKAEEISRSIQDWYSGSGWQGD